MDNGIWVRVRHEMLGNGRADTVITDRHGNMVRGVQSVSFVDSVDGKPELILRVIPEMFECEMVAKVEAAQPAG